MFDILGFGCAAVDDLLYVAAYPPVDSKTPVRRRDRQGGGLVATALVAAARQGAKCAYLATLGEDELSTFVLQRLRGEGIDVSRVTRTANAGPVHSVIVVGEDKGTRNIFPDVRGVNAAVPLALDEALVRSARVLLVDHFWIEQKLPAVRLARAAGIPVVADFEQAGNPRFPELLELVDHLILAAGFARQLTGTESPAAAVAKLWSQQRRVVAVTSGAAGCWYATRESPHAAQPQSNLSFRAGEESQVSVRSDSRRCPESDQGDSSQARNDKYAVMHLPAFPVQVVDTTGCGDVFHGAYAAGLARGLGIEECLRLAAATAALKATRPGGQTGIPTRQEVETFLHETQRPR